MTVKSNQQPSKKVGSTTESTSIASESSSPKFFSRVQAWFTQDPALSVLLLLAILYFCLYYFTDPARPAGMFSHFGFHDTSVTPKGWLGWNDQSWYMRLAQTLAHFDFHQLHKTFLYGFGYPILAVPFLWLGFQSDPFVFFDLFTFVLAAYATYAAAKRLISPTAGFIAGFGLVFASPLIHYVAEPWNTNVGVVAVSCMLLIATTKKINKYHYLAIGLLTGWVFAARYADGLFVGLLGIASVYRGWKPLFRLRHVMYAVIGLVITVVPVLYAQYRIFGSPLKTPYTQHFMANKPGSDQGLSSYSLHKIPKTAVAVFIGPKFVLPHDGNRGILLTMFWMLAGVLGVLYLFKRNKLLVCTWVGFVIFVTLFYLSFRGMGYDAIKYNVVHYLAMTWPITAILAAAAFDRLLSATRTRVSR